MVLYSRQLPLIGSFDVLVCGGGPAGIAAAITAAENGANVALLEQNSYLGGMATGGCVNPMS
ncbi:MAG: FAD-dependent oxidoreductase, partial [Victivallales bacterium]|nr:FAD-dependent oxidoreductase [Victivallales bacterium]